MKTNCVMTVINERVNDDEKDQKGKKVERNGHGYMWVGVSPTAHFVVYFGMKKSMVN